MKDILATLEAVTKTANEVKELLAKSMPPPPPPAMGKAEGQEPQGGNEPFTADPISEGGDMPSEAPEGAEQGGESVDEFAQEIASMSDEELDMLLQALAGEMEKRQGAMAPEGQPPAAQPPAAQPPAAPSPEMDAMKSENMAMRKSIQQLSSDIQNLKKSMSAPATRPASMNKPTQVVNKTTKEPEMLNKSEVLEHLEGLKKSGNKMVDTDMIWTANNARTDEDIKNVYHTAKVKGINIPTK